MEYRLWAKSPVWVGEIENPALPPIRLDDASLKGLLGASSPPPYRGTVKKRFTDYLERLFFDFDNNLLAPADSRATAEWLRLWVRDLAVGPEPESGDAAFAGEAFGALRCADWLDRAADGGWFVDWSV
jgi:hypothetical protein